MPKIPRLLATAGIPEELPQRRGYRADSAQAYLALADTITAAGDTFAKTRRIEQQRDIDIESSSLKSQMELEAGTAIEELKGLERDPDAFAKGADQALKDAYESVARQAKFAESKTELGKAFNALRVQRGLEIVKHRETLTTQRNTGLLTDELANLKVLGTNAPDTAEIGADGQPLQKTGKDYFAAGITAIEQSRLPADKKAEMRRDWRDTFYYERGYREVKEEPGADISRYRGVLKPESFDRLEKQQDSFRKEAVRVQEKRERDAETAAERQRQVDLTRLSQMATDKTLTRQHVIEARDTGLLTNRVEFEHYMTLATKGPAIESDPGTWSVVQADVWDQSKPPTLNEHKIRELMARAANGGVGLSGDHGRQALTELGRRRQEGITEGRTLENQERTRARESYTLAKEEAFRALGITTPLTQLDAKQHKLVTAFERAYNAVALDSEGNVKPGARQTMLDILPYFQNLQSGETRLSYAEQSAIASQTFGPVPDVMDPAYLGWVAKQQQDTLALAKDPKTLSLYKIRRDMLLQLNRTRTEYLNAEARKNAAAIGGKSTGGYKPPGEK